MNEDLILHCDDFTKRYYATLERIWLKFYLKEYGLKRVE